MNYELRESLAELEHKQWLIWNNEMCKILENIRRKVIDNDIQGAISTIDENINRWQKDWLDYRLLSEGQKDKDRQWADKVLEIMGGFE